MGLRALARHIDASPVDVTPRQFFSTPVVELLLRCRFSGARSPVVSSDHASVLLVGVEVDARGWAATKTANVKDFGDRVWITLDRQSLACGLVSGGGAQIDLPHDVVLLG
jgi:hypothetical protein